MQLALDNMPPSSEGWYETMLTNIAKDLTTNPENNPVAVKKALEAIAIGKEFASKGLSESSYTKMQTLAAKIKSLDSAASQTLKEDLKERVNQSFVQTQSSTISKDVLSGAILPYLEGKDLAAAQVVSKTWNEAADQQFDIQIVKYFNQLQSDSKAQQGSPLTLDIEKEYFDRRSFAALQKAIGKTVDFQKLLTALLHDPSLRPAGSAAENLTFYLMQNLGWNVEDPVLHSAPISETEIGQLSKSIASLMKNGPSQNQNWDMILKYPKAFIHGSLGNPINLPKWACNELRLSMLTNIKQVVLLAIKEYAHIYRRASPELKKDSEIIDAALRKDGSVLLYLKPSLITASRALLAINQSPALIADINIIKLLLSNDTYTKEQKTQFVQKAINQNALVFSSLPVEWRSDEAIAILAIKKDGTAFEHVNSDLQKNPKFILLALQTSAHTILPIAKMISQDSSLKQNLNLQEALDDALLRAVRMSKENPNLEGSPLQIMLQMRDALFGDSQILEGLRFPITDKDRALKLIQKEEWMALFMDDTLKTDPEFLKEAIQKNSKVREVIQIFNPNFIINDLDDID